jgi:hypothetical protein
MAAMESRTAAWRCTGAPTDGSRRTPRPRRRTCRRYCRSCSCRKGHSIPRRTFAVYTATERIAASCISDLGGTPRTLRRPTHKPRTKSRACRHRSTRSNRPGTRGDCKRAASCTRRPSRRPTGRTYHRPTCNRRTPHLFRRMRSARTRRGTGRRNSSPRSSPRHRPAHTSGRRMPDPPHTIGTLARRCRTPSRRSRGSRLLARSSQSNAPGHRIRTRRPRSSRRSRRHPDPGRLQRSRRDGGARPRSNRPSRRRLRSPLHRSLPRWMGP